MLFDWRRQVHIDGTGDRSERYQDASQEISLIPTHALFEGHRLFAHVVFPAAQDLDFLLSRECLIPKNNFRLGEGRSRVLDCLVKFYRHDDLLLPQSPAPF